MRAAYRTGRLTNGGGGLATHADHRLPQLSRRCSKTATCTCAITRSRCASGSIKANGHADNHVMLVEDNRYGAAARPARSYREALGQMDRWLTKLSRRHVDRSRDREDPRAPSRPTWWMPAGRAMRRRRRLPRRRRATSTSRCEQLYPSASFPREVAGAPVASDIVKCQLKPVERVGLQGGVHGRRDGAAEEDFPGGVCDWSKPGVEQQKLSGHLAQILTSAPLDREVPRVASPVPKVDGRHPPGCCGSNAGSGADHSRDQHMEGPARARRSGAVHHCGA